MTGVNPHDIAEMLEGVAMALGGQGLRSPVGPAIEGAGSAAYEGLSTVAESIDGLATAINRLADRMEPPQGDILRHWSLTGTPPPIDWETLWQAASRELRA